MLLDLDGLVRDSVDIVCWGLFGKWGALQGTLSRRFVPHPHLNWNPEAVVGSDVLGLGLNRVRRLGHWLVFDADS